MGEVPQGDVFDLERLRQLIELMESHGLRELDLQQGEQRIRLARGPEVLPAPVTIPQVPAPATAPTPPPAASSPEPEEDEHIVYIKSPMVGTFYSRPNPDAEPYVKVGDVVEPNTTVCIIEAMKVFNEIPAEVRGRIVAVLAHDEEPVDFGKPLFKVDTRV